MNSTITTCKLSEATRVRDQKSDISYLNSKHGNLNSTSISITLWGNFMDLYWTFKSTFIRTAHFFFEEEKKIVISAVLESKITLLRTTLIS